MINMETENHSLVISEVHEKCTNPECKEEYGKPTVTWWREMMKCKKCGTPFKRDDITYYTDAILFYFNNPDTPREEGTISVKTDRLNNLEHILNTRFNGILREIGERKFEKKTDGKGREFTVVIINLKFLGAIRAHAVAPRKQ